MGYRFAVNASDRNLKEDFAPVDARDILARVAAMPVTQWSLSQRARCTTHRSGCAGLPRSVRTRQQRQDDRDRERSRRGTRRHPGIAPIDAGEAGRAATGDRRVAQRARRNETRHGWAQRGRRTCGNARAAVTMRRQPAKLPSGQGVRLVVTPLQLGRRCSAVGVSHSDED